ncbi:MAG: DUF2867 domain-containing protein [Pseudomonadota bacterium]
MTLTFSKPQRSPDFEDVFSGPNAHDHLSAKELTELALSRTPSWFRALFAIRQFLARFSGLRTESEEGGPADVNFLLSLPVLRSEPNVFEAGLADKHLDFAMSVEKREGEVRITTSVWFNNTLGKVYLSAIKPFHERIVAHWVHVLGTPGEQA